VQNVLGVYRVYFTITDPLSLNLNPNIAHPACLPSELYVLSMFFFIIFFSMRQVIYKKLLVQSSPNFQSW